MKLKFSVSFVFLFRPIININEFIYLLIYVYIALGNGVRMLLEESMASVRHFWVFALFSL